MANKSGNFERRVAIITVVIAAIGVVVAFFTIPAVSDLIRPSAAPSPAVKLTVPRSEIEVRDPAGDGLERDNADPAWLKSRLEQAEAAAVDDSADAKADTAVR